MNINPGANFCSDGVSYQYGFRQHRFWQKHLNQRLCQHEHQFFFSHAAKNKQWNRDCIFSHVRPFYEQAASDLDP